MKKKNSAKDRKALGSVLGDWYGEARGDLEVSAHLPGSKNLRDVVSNLMEKTFTPEKYHFMNLAGNWRDVVGEAVSKYSRPASLSGKTLYIEVFRSVFIRELSIPQTKRMIIDRINAWLGGEVCEDVKFTPYGKRS